MDNTGCNRNQPVEAYQIYLGFMIFSVFFVGLAYCQNSVSLRRKQEQQYYLAQQANRQIARNNKQLRQTLNKAIEIQQIQIQQMRQENVKKLHLFAAEQALLSDQEQETSTEQNINQSKFSKAKTSKLNLSNVKSAKKKYMSTDQAWKRLSNYAYKYAQHQHEMLNIYRSAGQIHQQRQLYLNRQQRKKPQPQVTQKQKQKLKPEQKIQSPTKKQSSGIKRIQSFGNLIDTATKNQKKKTTESGGMDDWISTKRDQDKDIFDIELDQIAKPPEELPFINKTKDEKPIFGGIKLNPAENNKGAATTFNPSAPFGSLGNNNWLSNPIKTNQTQPKASIFGGGWMQQQPKVEPPKQINKLENKQIKQPQIKPQLQPNKPDAKKSQSLFPTLPGSTKPDTNLATTPSNPVSKPQTAQPSSATIGQPRKITDPLQYLQSIVKYSDTLVQKGQIATIISNLNGARSDPINLYTFASGYIKTIDLNNAEQVSTFTYRVWRAIVHQFIKTSNIKDGFETIPPRQRGKQVYKNQINTYVLLINIFRVLGAQTIWLGIFGKTLKMLLFMFKRKQTIKEWRKLELIQNKYVAIDGSMSGKYQTRLDFLIYFLIALTTFDPILAFSQISQKTGENYPFMQQLRKPKYKWSYRQFWCLVQSMRNNKQQTYFKIPFWTNVLSCTYLQMLSYMQQGQCKQFDVLSKLIIKEVKDLTKKMGTNAEIKALQDQDQENQDGPVDFDFDGEEFVNGIKFLGRGIDTKEREIRNCSQRWEDFRDKFSVFYYFWRLDTS